MQNNCSWFCLKLDHRVHISHIIFKKLIAAESFDFDIAFHIVYIYIYIYIYIIYIYIYIYKYLYIYMIYVERIY